MEKIGTPYTGGQPADPKAPVRPQLNPSPTESPSRRGGSPSAPRKRGSEEAPLLALLRGLLALVSLHTAANHDATGRALLAALGALAARVSEFCEGSAPGFALVAHTRGPVVGLQLARVDPDVEPLPDGHDPALAELARDLVTVLDHHDERGAASPGARALAALSWGALKLVRRHLQDPTTHLDCDTRHQEQAALRLVRASTVCSRVAPPGVQLSPVHVSLAESCLDAFEGASELRDLVLALDHDLDHLSEKFHAGTPLETYEVSNARETARSLVSMSWGIDGRLCELATDLTGVPPSRSTAAQVAALAALVAYAGPANTREVYRQSVLTNAHAAFTGTDD